MSYYQNKVAEAIRNGRLAAVRRHEENFQAQMENILRILRNGYIQNRFRVAGIDELETAEMERRFKQAGFETQSIDLLTFYVLIPLEEVEKIADVTSIPDMP